MSADAEFMRAIVSHFRAAPVDPPESGETRLSTIAGLLRLALDPADTVPVVDRIRQALNLAELP